MTRRARARRRLTDVEVGVEYAVHWSDVVSAWVRGQLVDGYAAGHDDEVLVPAMVFALMETAATLIASAPAERQGVLVEQMQDLLARTVMDLRARRRALQATGRG